MEKREEEEKIQKLVNQGMQKTTAEQIVQIQKAEEVALKRLDVAAAALEELKATTKTKEELDKIKKRLEEIERLRKGIKDDSKDEQDKTAGDELTQFEKDLVDLTNFIGTQLKSAMEPRWSTPLPQSWADDLNEKLKATAALLTTIGKALVNFGISGLASSDGKGFFSFLSGGLTGKADGGPVAANHYIVGEREPELFVPNSAGTIYNQDQMRDAMSTYSEGYSVLRRADEHQRRDHHHQRNGVHHSRAIPQGCR